MFKKLTAVLLGMMMMVSVAVAGETSEVQMEIDKMETSTQLALQGCIRSGVVEGLTVGSYDPMAYFQYIHGLCKAEAMTYLMTHDQPVTDEGVAGILNFGMAHAALEILFKADAHILMLEQDIQI